MGIRDEGERRFYPDGSIPTWDEVKNRHPFLDELHPKELNLVKAFYRAQKRLAQGKPKKARRIFAGLDRNPDFLALEDRYGSLLSEIARFVRGRAEKKRQKEGLN